MIKFHDAIKEETKEDNQNWQQIQIIDTEY